MGEVSGLTIFTKTPHILAYPKDVYELEIIMAHTGNKDVINVLMSVEGKISGWDVKFPEEPIHLYQGQSKIIPIRIRMPIWSRIESEPGDLRNITFVAVIEGAPSTRDSATFTFEIMPYGHMAHDLILPVNLNFDPGENFTATLKVHYNSNFDDTLSISSLDQSGFFDIGLNNVSWAPLDVFLLKKGESFHINIRVKISEEAMKGEYLFWIILDPDINDPIEIPIKINISFVGNLKLSLVNGIKDVKDNTPINEPRTHKLKVTNNGNGNDLVKLSMGRLFYDNMMVKVPLDKGWKAGFLGVGMADSGYRSEVRMTYSELIKLEWLNKDMYYRLSSAERFPSYYHELQFWIGAGETWHIDMVYWAETENGASLVEDSYIQVISRSMNPLVVDMVSFDLRPIYPDLLFVDGFHFFNSVGKPVREPTSEGNYSLLFTVSNIGNTSSSSTYLLTTIDGEEIIRSELDPLEPESKIEIVISFTMKEGSHSIWIEIDPQNDVHELNDQIVDGGKYDNNQKTLLVEIEEEKGAFPVGAIALGLTFSILAMVILLFILLFIWRRPRSHPEEE
jgi:hypothetical protein